MGVPFDLTIVGVPAGNFENNTIVTTILCSMTHFSTFLGVFSTVLGVCSTVLRGMFDCFRGTFDSFRGIFWQNMEDNSKWVSGKNN